MTLSPGWVDTQFARQSREAWHSRHNCRMKCALNRELPSAKLSSQDEDDVLRTCVKRMQAGDSDGQAALAELYDASVNRVFSLIKRFVGGDAAAEDVTQEVYLQAWMQCQRFDARRGAVMAWLLNLARSRALDAWRKNSNSVVLMDGDIAQVAASQLVQALQPADFLEATEARSTLHEAISQLPATTRQMLSLAFFQDFTHQEIGDYLQIPLGTVKSTIRRALLSLREQLITHGWNASQLNLEHEV